MYCPLYVFNVYAYYKYAGTYMHTYLHSLFMIILMQLQLFVILLRIFSLDLGHLWTNVEYHTYLRNLNGLFMFALRIILPLNANNIYF